MLLALLTAHAQSLVPNGSFETGDLTDWDATPAGAFSGAQVLDDLGRDRLVGLGRDQTLALEILSGLELQVGRLETTRELEVFIQAP